MASLEKFCLRWNDFETNVSQAFRELREEKDFFDVTLACEDEQLSAHKVILSACSPFFRNILRKNPHQHPLLYLKGVKYQEMLSVLNFMYMGEVNVAQEELNSFLAVAEELRVKGLTQGEGTSNGNSQEREPPEKDHRPPQKQQRLREKEEVTEVARLPVKVEPPTEVAVSNYSRNTAYRVSEPSTYTSNSVSSMAKQADYSSNATNTYQPEAVGDTYACEEYAGEDYEEQEGEEEYSLGNGFTGDDAYHASGVGAGASADLIAAREEEIVSNIVRDSERKVFTCALCQFTASSRHKVFCHLESKHYKDSSITYSCPFCQKVLSSRNSLGIHVSRNHKHERGNSLNSIFPKDH